MAFNLKVVSPSIDLYRDSQSSFKSQDFSPVLSLIGTHGQEADWNDRDRGDAQGG